MGFLTKVAASNDNVNKRIAESFLDFMDVYLDSDITAEEFIANVNKIWKTSGNKMLKTYSNMEFPGLIKFLNEVKTQANSDKAA